MAVNHAADVKKGGNAARACRRERSRRINADNIFQREMQFQREKYRLRKTPPGAAENPGFVCAQHPQT